MLVLGGLLIAAGLLTWAYRSRARWTGFVGYTYSLPDNQEHVASKTLWDWLQLLLIPATLSAGVLLFNSWQGNRDRERAERQARVDRQVAINDQRERALQAYIDQISGLILNRHLRRSNVGSDLRIVARTRTLTTLRGLDSARKGILVRFLSESKLIENPDPLVNLTGADLSGAMIGGANLSNAYLRGVRLRRAHLDDANLREADLTEADLAKACLQNANLNDSTLDDAKFTDAYMSNVTLDRAGIQHGFDQPEPSSRHQPQVDFRRSYLVDADGEETRLEAGDFTDAYVTNPGTAIEGANLSEAQRPPMDELDAVKDKKWGYCF